MPNDIFRAIADPTRRAIIDILVREPLSVNEVAENFTISRPAISKHIKLLNECGLVVIHKEGRKRICRANPQKLKKVAEWTTKYSHFWAGGLDALEKKLAEGEKDKH